MSIEALANLSRSGWRSIADRELARSETRLFIDGHLSYTRTASAWIRPGRTA